MKPPPRASRQRPARELATTRGAPYACPAAGIECAGAHGRPARPAPLPSRVARRRAHRTPRTAPPPPSLAHGRATLASRSPPPPRLASLHRPAPCSAPPDAVEAATTSAPLLPHPHFSLLSLFLFCRERRGQETDISRQRSQDVDIPSTCTTPGSRDRALEQSRGGQSTSREPTFFF